MSRFDEIIERSGTNSAKYNDERLKEDPQLISMWVADMDFKAPEEVLEAIKKRVDHGIFGYGMPGEEYYQAVMGWMKRRHDFEIEKEWIIPFPGVVAALRNCIYSFTKKGESVVIFRPVYYPFTVVVEDADRKVLSCELIEKEGRYQIDFDLLEKQLALPETTMLILCSPHNPVGRVWTREELARIVDLTLRYGVILVSDEIHMDFVYAPKKHVSIYQADWRSKENGIICTAPSKTFNLAGLRASNIIIANPELNQRFVETMHRHGIEAPDLLALEAVKAAYTHGDAWLDELKDYLQANYSFMKEYLAEHHPEITLSPFDALYLVWADFRKLGMDKDELEDFMLHQAHLWLDEGYIFGDQGAGFERFNIAAPRSVLEKALKQLSEALNRRNQQEK